MVELESERARGWDYPARIAVLSSFLKLLLGSFEPEV